MDSFNSIHQSNSAGSILVGALPVLLSLVLAGNALGADRYVDCSRMTPGDGSAGNPWNTIGAAANNAGSRDVVHVSNGPCAVNSVNFRAHLSGAGNCLLNETDCTIFKGDPGPVDIVPASDGVDGFVVNGIDGPVENLKFQDFVFKEDGALNFGEPVRNRNGRTSFLVFQRVTIEGMGNHGVGFRFLAGPGGSHDLLFDDSHARDTLGEGFVMDGQPRCSNDATKTCAFDANCGGGTCEPRPFYNVTFRRATAAANDKNGFVSPANPVTHAYNFTFENVTIATNNALDGFDIVADFQNQPGQVTKLLDVHSYTNAIAGMQIWHSAQIENARVILNGGPGIRVVRTFTTEPPFVEDTSTARVTIIAGTIANNSGVQLLIDRRSYADVKVFNTIASSGNAAPEPVPFKYDKLSGSAFAVAWDYDLLHRELDASCSPSQSCAFVVAYGPGQMDGCNAANVKNCDGASSHPNSIGGKPIFENTNLMHLTSSSPGWNQGVNPSTIAGLSPFRAHLFDLDGHARPRDGAFDIGAYEGSGSSGGGGC